MERLAHDLVAFESEAEVFAQTLAPKTQSATLVTLTGELGAGKTAFVKAAGRALGVREEITSPTFVLMKSYELPRETGSAGFARLVHIDAYRLEGDAQLEPLHFDEVLKQADNLIMLEWPERVANILPKADVAISIEALPDGSRKLTYV